MSQPNPFEAPRPDAPLIPADRAPLDTSGDATGGLIPYKNPSALAAYYLGIIGMFPVIGIFASIPAFVLGIMGLRARKRNPAIKGSVHAWIGIVLGFLATLANLSCISLMVVGLVGGAVR
ncbi:DUF4190 domain-containing protein [Bremerella cremea]|uniref:DUF4190 domain-containing protein n=1 Tax=Bremerella cremea TaxID=1031537 RepID=UPI0031E62DCC